jgi:hypothetical protein
MTLFRNKYRIEPARLPDWDYSKSGFYFITICAFKHVCTFGEIIEREMQVNEYGIILRQEWEKSFEIRCELKRDEFCIMPNHFHAVVRTLVIAVKPETHGRASLQETPNTGSRIVRLNRFRHSSPGLNPPSRYGLTTDVKPRVCLFGNRGFTTMLSAITASCLPYVTISKAIP